MVKEDVISVCPQIHFSSLALLSIAVGLTPASRLIPSLLCPLASGFGQRENWWEAGGCRRKGAHRTALCFGCFSSMAAYPLWLIPPPPTPWTGPLRCQLLSCDLGSGLWKPHNSLWLSLPLFISGCHATSCLASSSSVTLVPNSRHWFLFIKKW